jgi:hypothetical protein
MCWLIWIALVVSGIIRAIRNRRERANKGKSDDKKGFAEVNPTA